MMGALRSCIRPVFSLMAMALLAMPAFAEEIQFTASVDKEQVALDDRLVLSLSVVGARNANEPKLPASKGFQVMSSGTTTQFNFVQGRMYASRSFTYVLVPQKIGTYTLGPFQWKYEGRQYTAPTISVEVVEPGGPTGATGPGAMQQMPSPQPAGGGNIMRQLDMGDRLFVQVKADKEEAYLNEQVILIFRLYRRGVSLDDLQYTPPQTVGFLEEGLGKQKETREMVNGILYDVIELKTALFPASTGEMTVGPASLKCNVLVRTHRRRPQEEGFFGGIFDESFFGDPFFERLAKYPVELKSKPITIRVKPLPAENKPADFRGAVGDYQMEAWVKPANLKVGEPASLTMKVVGTGNIPTLPSPAVEDIEGFKSYDSESKVNLQERIDVIGGEKVFERVLIPQKAGKLKIPPVHFSFFNPRTGSYETLKEGPFWLDVQESAEGRAAVVVSSSGTTASKEDVRIVKRDILFIKERLGPLRRPAQEWTHRWTFWSLQGLPLLLLLGTLLFERRRRRLSSDAGLLRFRAALGRSKAGLKAADRLLVACSKDAQEQRQVYQVLYRALCDYICDRWNLPVGEITPQEIRDVLGGKGMGAATAQKTSELIEQINQGRFARVLQGQDALKKLLGDVRCLIHDLERASR